MLISEFPKPTERAPPIIPDPEISPYEAKAGRRSGGLRWSRGAFTPIVSYSSQEKEALAQDKLTRRERTGPGATHDVPDLDMSGPPSRSLFLLG